MLEGKVNKVKRAWAKGEQPKANNKDGRIKEEMKVHRNEKLSQSEIINRVKILLRSKVIAAIVVSPNILLEIT